VKALAIVSHRELQSSGLVRDGQLQGIGLAMANRICDRLLANAQQRI
jgi:hypothetical protein